MRDERSACIRCLPSILKFNAQATSHQPTTGQAHTTATYAYLSIASDPTRFRDSFHLTSRHLKSQNPTASSRTGGSIRCVRQQEVVGFLLLSFCRRSFNCQNSSCTYSLLIPKDFESSRTLQQPDPPDLFLLAGTRRDLSGATIPNSTPFLFPRQLRNDSARANKASSLSLTRHFSRYSCRRLDHRLR